MVFSIVIAWFAKLPFFATTRTDVFQQSELIMVIDFISSLHTTCLAFAFLRFLSGSRLRHHRYLTCLNFQRPILIQEVFNTPQIKSNAYASSSIRHQFSISNIHFIHRLLLVSLVPHCIVSANVDVDEPYFLALAPSSANYRTLCNSTSRTCKIKVHSLFHHRNALPSYSHSPVHA
jgi:hypothetical protein